MCVRLIIILVLATLPGWSDESRVKIEDRGYAIYRDNCMDCHLTTGMGIREMNAPSIAGLPRWYITDQLRKFRREERGSHNEDPSGILMQMKAMTLAETDLVFVGKYIESLAPNPQRNTANIHIEDTTKTHYMADCSRCHGDKAEGVRSERAPPLIRQPDWYLTKQMESFRNGIREHTKDAAYVERSEAEANAIIAWIAGLPVEATE